MHSSPISDHGFMLDIRGAFIVTDGLISIHRHLVKRPIVQLGSGQLWPGEPDRWPPNTFATIAEGTQGEVVELPSEALEAAKVTLERQAIAGLPVEYRVLSFLDENGPFHGCREDIAEQLCVTRVVIKRTVLALERDGFIDQETNARAGSSLKIRAAGRAFLEFGGLVCG
jgi:hypothetical protein